MLTTREHRRRADISGSPDLVCRVCGTPAFRTLVQECIAWHLKYDESFIGNAIASGTAPDYMKDAAAMDIRRLSSVSMLSCAGLKRNIAAACSRLGEEFAFHHSESCGAAHGREH